ncbi:hypothetical protein KTT_23290 [Tengunoibacter tsumagoiensis]|uniref:Uncharacterized protein n=1 Tax=Tengunoibacter tsumagoiensis TaxID=2014871 RepID=A0A402A001_9CHLR|nr:hypothetical protein KTT_23290 [Tengunoibacter tsumagoiensis]
MQFHIFPMTEENARQVASWQYEAPYDFYNMDQDPGYESMKIKTVYRSKPCCSSSVRKACVYG